MGAAKVHEFNEATKGMALPTRSAAARIHAVRKRGGAAEVRAQAKAMSKTKRKVRVRRKRGGY